MICYLGFDGGGTKTECYALDSSGRVAGRGAAGASNPLRVGYEAAVHAIDNAAMQALNAAQSQRFEVRGACVALAGAGRPRVVDKIREDVTRIWPAASIRVITDAEAALEAAIGQGAGVVLIAGTGSMAIGRDAKGAMSRAGGYGPWIGDRGSAYDIGRRAVEAASRANDLSGPSTVLFDRIIAAMHSRSWDDVVEAIAASPDRVFPGLFPVVANAADAADEVARTILGEAALELSKLALSVIGALDLRDQQFTLARSGGVFNRTPILDRRVDELISHVAPKAAIGLLQVPPALAAAQMALRFASPKNTEHVKVAR
jgi:N-acetylglucosamine kinase-like BadF-type ATPase